MSQHRPTPELVSIIMPAYQAAETLEKAVTGILSQQYPHWELLLLLDGPNEAEQELANRLSAREPRIRLIVSAKNRGVIAARNVGTRLAKGQWIAFCDADDFWHPQKLELQLAAASTEAAQIVCSSFWFWMQQGEEESWRYARLPQRLNKRTMLRTNAIPMSTAMYHAVHLGKQYFRPMPEGLIHEDYDFWLGLMQMPNIKACGLANALACIRVLHQSRSANKWLAMRSHAYILRHRGGLNGWSFYWSMLHYLGWGLTKRFTGSMVRRHPWEGK